MKDEKPAKKPEKKPAYLREVVGDTEPDNKLLDSRPVPPAKPDGPKPLHN